MPRKVSTIAPAVRIRENQRRARTRRKELIDDLKRRTRACETQGVTATARVQEAAREVLLENKRLRALLMEKGVPTAEIEASLHGDAYDASFTIASATPESAGIIDTQSQAALSVGVRQPVKMHASGTTNQLISAASPPTMPMDIGLESSSQAGKDGRSARSSSDMELVRPDEQVEKDVGWATPLSNLLEHVSDCYCPDIEPVPGQAQSSETDCSVAANIFADFRGHGDAEQARAELGCPGTAKCGITNAALLHALDSVM
ncbi:MAG: hypothetical protein M1828_006573 [Chrysothrix sp. TS-e1954]|nr:MAG: hypothetical protein M1828_006573 [Chrysothrix sp. TS-e1954]